MAIDLIFAEPDTVAQYDLGGEKMSGAESDLALGDAVKTSGNVVLLADTVNEGLVGGQDVTTHASWRDPGYRLGPRVEERPVILAPLQPLTDGAAALGHNFLALDGDGPARRMPPFVRNGDHYLPSLGIAAALRAGGFRPDEVVLEGDAIRVRDRHIPLVPLPVKNSANPAVSHDQLTMLIDYRAPAVTDMTPYRRFELRHLLKSEGQLLDGEKPLIDPAVFKDKIVFIGLNASGLGDVFVTPFGSTSRMPGIQVPRQHGRQPAVEPLHPPRIRWLSNRRRGDYRGLRRYVRGVPAVHRRGDGDGRCAWRVGLAHAERISRTVSG